MKFKMAKDFLDISELSKELELYNKKTGKPANHILRYWEKEFKIIRPIISKGKRRYYDKNQVEKIRYIKFLLKDKGLTIKGVKKVLNDKKTIDATYKNNIDNEYFKTRIKDKSDNILKKLKDLKKHG